MNFFKKAIEITDFKSRNTANKNLRQFSDIVIKLNKLSKIIFQNARMARSEVDNILLTKKLSSYPDIETVLVEAKRVALDDPWQFAGCCRDMADKIAGEIIPDIEKKRKEFANPSENTYLKGLPIKDDPNYGS